MLVNQTLVKKTGKSLKINFINPMMFILATFENLLHNGRMLFSHRDCKCVLQFKIQIVLNSAIYKVSEEIFS